MLESVYRPRWFAHFSPFFVLEAFLRLVTVDVALRLVSPKALLRTFARGGAVFARVGECSEVERALQVVRGLERRLYRPNCLRSALTVFWMSRGPYTLKIGVLKNNPAFEAHAWLESQGVHFSGNLHPDHYADILSYPKAL